MHIELTAKNRHMFERVLRDEKQKLSITEMPPIPKGDSPMDYDLTSMGTHLTNKSEWMILFESGTDTHPMRGVYLHNSLTGQRHAINIDPEKPKIKKIISLLNEEDDCIPAGCGNDIYEVLPERGIGYRVVVAGSMYVKRPASARKCDNRFLYFIHNRVGIHVSVKPEEIGFLHAYDKGDFIFDEDRLKDAISAYTNFLQEHKADHV